MADRDVTRILQRVSGGNVSAVDELTSAVYAELRALAQAYLQRERPDHTLSATAVVHEAYLKLIDQSRSEYRDRRHFFAIAAHVMRRILVDHARARGSIKRGGRAERLILSEGGAVLDDAGVDLVELDDTLVRLAQLNERQARIVELHFFGGLTLDEVADILGVSPRTVDAEWRMARWWLRRELSP